jgi:hypothetical protein
LPKTLRDDLVRFLDTLPPDSSDWSAIDRAVGKSRLPPPDQVLRQVREIFQIDDGADGMKTP